jgi:hypothetical protein
VSICSPADRYMVGACPPCGEWQPASGEPVVSCRGGAPATAKCVSSKENVKQTRHWGGDSATVSNSTAVSRHPTGNRSPREKLDSESRRIPKLPHENDAGGNHDTQRHRLTRRFRCCLRHTAIDRRIAVAERRECQSGSVGHRAKASGQRVGLDFAPPVGQFAPAHTRADTS